MKALMVFQATPHSNLGMSSLMNLVSVSFRFIWKYIYIYIVYLFFLKKDLDGKWGMRIESALSVRKVKVSFCW